MLNLVINTSLYPSINTHVETYIKESDQIPNGRKEILKALTLFVEGKVKAGKQSDLIFICTHNSRRSHIAQVWAQAAAYYYNLPNVVTYSGGTEATAFNPRAVRAMQEAGFNIVKTKEAENPLYEVRFSVEANPILAFSKKYDDPFNPTKDFTAIMTCSHADENCPLLLGASARIALTYNDPKDFDDTPLEAAKYTERVHEIGREIFYAFSQVKA